MSEQVSEQVGVFRSGFAAVVGRPNVGKSTLVNTMVGTKVTITSPRPNTTRSQVRGVLNRPDAQVVFVDTPGLHKPRTALGERMNESATSSLDDVDVVVAMVEATGAVGPGDRMVLAQSAHRVRSMARAARWPPSSEPVATTSRGDPTLLVVVNKIDRVGGDGVLTHLTAVSDGDRRHRRRGRGTADPGRVLPGVGHHRRGGGRRWSRRWWPGCPRAPATTPRGWSPMWPRPSGWPTWSARSCSTGSRTSCPTASPAGSPSGSGPGSAARSWSSGTRRRASSSARAGATLKEVGTAVRAQMPPGAYLELFVRVEKRWQHREDALDRLGF